MSMRNKQTILIVDDEKSNIEMLINLFKSVKSNYNIIPVLSGEKALKAVQKREVDLILLDIMMPQMDGYEVCKILKSQTSTQEIPILFITSSSDDDSIIKAYNLGASDYVTKPFRAVELLARVQLNLRLQETIKKLEYFAYYDELTNIYNRRKFFELASKKFEAPKANLYGVMIDIDRFKGVNDLYGHAVGDEMIKAIVRSIQEGLSQEMIFGRIGGEEFAIVFDVEGDVVALVESLRSRVAQTKIRIDANTLLSCTISSGIAKQSEDMSRLDHLLQKADKALYEAKKSGRDKTVYRD